MRLLLTTVALLGIGLAPAFANDTASIYDDKPAGPATPAQEYSQLNCDVLNMINFKADMIAYCLNNIFGTSNGSGTNTQPPAIPPTEPELP